MELKPYTVVYRDDPLSVPEGYFVQAEDSDHAEEQTLDAYPGADVLWIVEKHDYWLAIKAWVNYMEEV